MSLDNPSRFDLFLRSLRDVPNIRIYLSLAAGLVLMLGVLFTVDRYSGWRQRRDIDKKRQEVNAALNNLANAQAQTVIDKIDEAKHKQDVIDKTQDYLNAVNATDAARAETNRALQNLNSAVSNGRNVGITANDLEKKLNEVQ